MATYYPTEPNNTATHGDFLVTQYGERYRIIGETPNGRGHLAINDKTGIRRVFVKVTPETHVIIGVTS